MLANINRGHTYKSTTPFMDYHQLAADIKQWGRDLGFQKVGITDVDLSTEQQHLERWLAAGMHGDMEWMARHAELRTGPINCIRCSACDFGADELFTGWKLALLKP